MEQTECKSLSLSTIPTLKDIEQSIQPLYPIDATLLSPPYHKYRDCPQQYLIQQIQFSTLWPQVSLQTVTNFLFSFRNIYNPVAYHNLTHAFDVTTTLSVFLKGTLAKQISKQDVSYMLLAAYAHDAGHEGLTNHFYSRSNHPLSNQYPISPLQHMHAAHLMNTLRLHNIEVPKCKSELMIRMILHTDNHFHQQMLSKVEEQGIEPYLGEVLLHMADVSQGARTIDIAIKWNKLLYIEFEKEKQISFKNLGEENMSIMATPLEICRGNVIFFNRIVIPLYEMVSRKDNYYCQWLEKIKNNVKYWQQKTQELKIMQEIESMAEMKY